MLLEVLNPSVTLLTLYHYYTKLKQKVLLVAFRFFCFLFVLFCCLHYTFVRLKLNSFIKFCFFLFSAMDVVVD